MNIVTIFAIIAALAVLALGVVYAGTALIWKIIQKSTPGETVVGQVCWIQKAKIPGYRQLLFSYTKKGKPCKAISRPIWHKKKFKLKGMYQIKVFHRKIGNKGTTVWADPISDRNTFIDDCDTDDGLTLDDMKECDGSDELLVQLYELESLRDILSLRKDSFKYAKAIDCLLPYIKKSIFAKKKASEDNKMSSE